VAQHHQPHHQPRSATRALPRSGYALGRTTPAVCVRLRFANAATEAHQALALVRFGSVTACWLLTAMARGKSAEHLDVLVGLAVGPRAMITNG
jgi:hypothetical protein